MVNFKKRLRKALTSKAAGPALVGTALTGTAVVSGLAPPAILIAIPAFAASVAFLGPPGPNDKRSKRKQKRR